MSPTRVTSNTGTGTTVGAVTYGAAPSLGNLLLLSCSGNRGAASVPTVTTPAGWTLLNTGSQVNGASAGGAFLFGKIATSGDVSGGTTGPTVASTTGVWVWATEEWPTSGAGNIDVSAFPHIVGTPQFVTAGTTVTAPITTTAANEWTVSVLGGRGNMSTATWSGGSTVDVAQVANGASSNGTATQLVAAASSVTPTATFTNGTGAPVIVGMSVSFLTISSSPTGDAALAPTFTTAAAGVVGTSTGAAVAPTVTVSTSGAVGTLTGTTVSPTVAIATSGVVGSSTGAARATTVTIATSGAVGTSTGAAVSPTVVIAAAGAVGTASGASRPTTVTITTAGVVGAQTASTVGVSVSIVAAGVVGAATSAAVSVSIGITASGHVHTDIAAVDVVIAIDVDAEQWAVDGNRGARWAIRPVDLPPWLVLSRPDPWVIR